MFLSSLFLINDMNIYAFMVKCNLNNSSIILFKYCLTQILGGGRRALYNQSTKNKSMKIIEGEAKHISL